MLKPEALPPRHRGVPFAMALGVVSLSDREYAPWPTS